MTTHHFIATYRTVIGGDTYDNAMRPGLSYDEALQAANEYCDVQSEAGYQIEMINLRSNDQAAPVSTISDPAKIIEALTTNENVAAAAFSFILETDLTTTVQEMLLDEGVDCGPEDGIVDDLTTALLRKAATTINESLANA